MRSIILSFGEEKSTPNVTLVDTVRIQILATFIFKYRSIGGPVFFIILFMITLPTIFVADILRADGIAPPLPSIIAQKSGAGKRNADALEEEPEEEEVDDGIEERAEAELKVLLVR